MALSVIDQVIDTDRCMQQAEQLAIGRVAQELLPALGVGALRDRRFDGLHTLPCQLSVLGFAQIRPLLNRSTGVFRIQAPNLGVKK